MGLENRDYYRDGSYTDRISGFGIDFTPVVKRLIVANVLVFLLQIFITRSALPADMPEFPEEAPGEVASAEAELDWTEIEAKAGRGADKGKKDEVDWKKQQDEAIRKAREMQRRMMQSLGGRISVVQEWLELDPVKTVKQGQVWRLLTCAFCHDRYSVWHIVFNMLCLYWFGRRLETMYGSREFLLFYLAAAVTSSVAYVALAWYTNALNPAIGASGAVMGVMMVYTIFYPFETFLLFWMIPVPMWAMLSLYVIYDLHPVLLALAGDQIFTQVAHAGHLGGLAFGFVYWKLGLRLETPFHRRSRRRPLRVWKPEPLEEPTVLAHPHRDSFNDQLDEVLRKITEHGQASLTDEERDLLMKASARYRGKQ